MSMSSDIGPGTRIVATDAYGETHPGVVMFGPARDRDGIRGAFVKVWVRLDGREDEIPWPVESVATEDPS